MSSFLASALAEDARRDLRRRLGLRRRFAVAARLARSLGRLRRLGGVLVVGRLRLGDRRRRRRRRHHRWRRRAAAPAARAATGATGAGAAGAVAAGAAPWPRVARRCRAHDDERHQQPERRARHHHLLAVPAPNAFGQAARAGRVAQHARACSAAASDPAPPAAVIAKFENSSVATFCSSFSSASIDCWRDRAPWPSPS